MPWIEQKYNAGQSTQLKDPECLGYIYYLLTPSDLNSVWWKRIPLSLIKSLSDDEIEPEGVIILEASEEATIYQVEGFEDEIWLPSKFANYIKQLGNIDKMIDVGIILKKAADITKRKIEQLDSVKTSSIITQVLSAQAATTGKITKKVTAYQLFGQGKGPSSPEVKALGLHKSTRYKYYAQFLKLKQSFT